MHRLGELFEDRWLRYYLLLIAVAYAYGALVHVLNMLSVTGFEWSNAPLKWQVLDVAYLIIDVTAVIGLIRKRAFGIIAFLIGAVSQILLYTVFRKWIIDVPIEFAPTPEQVTYLTTLVWFHIVALAIFAILLLRRWRFARARK